MAGSNREKLRGQNDKNRTYLQLFLNMSGLRVDSVIVGGPLSKKVRRRGTFRSGPPDLDLRARI